MSTIHNIPLAVDRTSKAWPRSTRLIPALTGKGIVWIVAGAIAAAYMAIFALLSPLPLQDLPTHLARAVVMDDLMFHGGNRFGDVYQFHFLLIPYVLGDLVLACAVELLGPIRASALWGAVEFLSLPLAVLFYLRITGLAERRRPLLFLVSIYLATDWSFTMGFVSFRFGIAMSLIILGLVGALRRRWSAGLFLTYFSTVLLGYLMHLSVVLWISAAAGVTGLLRMHWRETNLRTECLLAMPVIAVLLWHFGVADHIRIAGDVVENPYTWGTLHEKFARLGSEFFRYSGTRDIVMILMLAGCLVLQMSIVKKEQFRSRKVTEALALALTFVGLYLALPMAYSEASYVDVRALPLAGFFFILTCMVSSEAGPAISQSRMVLALMVAAALAVANLVSLTTVLIRNQGFLMQYRSVVAAIPAHARVFPVSTLHAQGAVEPLLHANSFITIDRSGVTPYEFSGDNGNPDRYFRYLKRPYDPPEDWYFKMPALKLDWESVACDYDFLIVTQPYAAQRFLLSTRIVARNDAAALLAIDKRECNRLHPGINRAL